MSLALTVAIVIVIAILLFAGYRKSVLERRYASSKFGYFINQQHLSAIFPQTGEPLIVTEMGGRYIATTVDEATGTLVPRVFPELGSKYVIIPDLKSASADATLVLYVSASTTDVVDDKVCERVCAALDDDTKMPMIKVCPAGSAGSTWKFTPVVMRVTDKVRKLFGLSFASGGNIFAEMPDQFPAWVTKHVPFSTAMKGGNFKGTLMNFKYPGLQYTSGAATMKRWGKVGIMIVNGSTSTEDPQILLIPTPTNMVFRVFSLQTATLNAATSRLEGYRQLVATNGAAFELSKTIIDTDSARWTLVLA
jgi:hypothetical protein